MAAPERKPKTKFELVLDPGSIAARNRSRVNVDEIFHIVFDTLNL